MNWYCWLLKHVGEMRKGNFSGKASSAQNVNGRLAGRRPVRFVRRFELSVAQKADTTNENSSSNQRQTVFQQTRARQRIKKFRKQKKNCFLFFLSWRQPSDMSDRKRQQEVYLDQLKQLVPGVNSHTASKVTHSGWSWSNVNWYGTRHQLYQIIIWQLMAAMVIRPLDGQLLVNKKYWIRKQQIKPHCSRS